MDKSSKDITDVTTTNAEHVSVSSVRSTATMSFFNTPVMAQVVGPQHIQFSYDPPSFSLLSGLLKEMKTRNEIELEKLKRESEQKQTELNAAKAEKEAAKKAEADDQKQFEENRHLLYA